MRKFLVMFIIISAMLVTLATEKLVIYHWWTAGGER